MDASAKLKEPTRDTRVGLPPTGGFVGKWYLLSAAVANAQWWVCVVVIAGAG